MIAESPRNFLARLFAPALALAGAVLLLAGLAGNSEAQDRTRDTRAGFTLEFAGDTPDYHSADLCARLGGKIVQVTVGVLPACTKIDTSGTFCIAGSREVFPCRGLYRTALLCNQYNRPARNPFVCEGECSSGGVCLRQRMLARGDSCGGRHSLCRPRPCRRCFSGGGYADFLGDDNIGRGAVFNIVVPFHG